MRKYLLAIALGCMVLITTQAQEYKVKKVTGKLIINLSTVTVEGYNGNEIIFSSQDKKEEEADPRAEGLERINTAGFRDNSGLGVSVIEKGNTVEVNEVTQNIGTKSLGIKILVPKGMAVSFEWGKVTAGSKATFRNLESEIEIDSYDDSVLLENITGPLSVRATYGAIDVIFKAPVKGPVIISALHASIDVSVPLDMKANIKLGNLFGPIMVSPDIKIDLKKREEEPEDKNATIIEGTMNGGGLNCWLNARFGKMYLRKTK